jgi:hypothetical protein
VGSCQGEFIADGHASGIAAARTIQSISDFTRERQRAAARLIRLAQWWQTASMSRAGGGSRAEESRRWRDGDSNRVWRGPPYSAVSTAILNCNKRAQANEWPATDSNTPSMTQQWKLLAAQRSPKHPKRTCEKVPAALSTSPVDQIAPTHHSFE